MPLTACSAGTVQCGTTVTGRVSVDSCETSDYVFGVGYAFNGTAGQRLTLIASSPSYRMVAALFDGRSGNLTMYAENQAASNGSAAQITNFVLPYTGPYAIILSPLLPFTFGDYSLTVGCASAPPPPPPPPTIGCVPASFTACLLGGRFKATVRYRSQFDSNAVDSTARVKSVSGFANTSYETAFFYFNDSSNIEMMVKMLDQGNRDSAGRPTIAVLFGTATPLRVELTISDTSSLAGINSQRKYTSPFNSMTGGTDFTAFLK